jgi:uncharacterized membrane protein YfcA
MWDVTGLFAVLILIAVGGGFCQRVAGFGLGIFSLIFLPFFLPTVQAAAMCSLLSLAIASYNSFRHRQHIQLKLLLPVMIAATVTIPLAVYFSADVPQNTMKLLLGVALCLLSTYFLFLDERIHFKPTVPNGIAAGALGGTLTGLFSTGGPPVVLYLLHSTSDKYVYFATIQTYFALTALYSNMFRLTSGILTWRVVIFAAVSLVGTLIGNQIGGKVFDRLDSKKFKQVIYIGMIISGIIMIVNAI